MIILLIFAIGFGVNGQAQTKLTEEQKEELLLQYEEDMESLQLSKEQRDTYKDIMMNHAQEMKALKEGNESRREKYKKYKALQDSKDGEMKALLSKEQYKKYQAIQERRKKEVKERRKENK